MSPRTNNIRVLAIDPGYDRLGVAVLEGTATTSTLLYSTCITTDPRADLPERLHEIGQRVSKLLHEHRPNILAIEALFFNKNTTTAMGVAEVRGAIIFLAKEAGCAIREFGPQEVKVALTGYGKSDKGAVTSMVKRLVKGAPKKAHDDEYDAIAVGVTALAHEGQARVHSS